MTNARSSSGVASLGGLDRWQALARLSYRPSPVPASGPHVPEDPLPPEAEKVGSSIGLCPEPSHRPALDSFPWAGVRPRSSAPPPHKP